MMLRGIRHLGAAAAAVAAARVPAYTLADDAGKKSKLRSIDFPLADHHYGKLRVRVLKVRRTQAHSVSEYTVQTRLFNPEYARVYTHEDNTNLIATDTQKNTVYYVAKRTNAESPEQFGIDIARHFMKEYPILTAAEVEVKETLWQRALIDGTPHDHGFFKTAPEQAIANVRLARNDMEHPEVVSRIEGKTVLKTTQCGFENFLHDQFTLLPDTNERCLSTELSAEWRYVPNTGSTAYDYTLMRDIVHQKVAEGIFGPAQGGIYSHSVQATIYDIGCMVLESAAPVESITIRTPNIHYLPFNALSSLGEKFENDIFVPTSEPSGMIECRIARDGHGGTPSVVSAALSAGPPPPPVAQEKHIQASPLPLSTHVLNMSTGKPCAGVKVIVEQQTSVEPERWAVVAKGETNSDGRISNFSITSTPGCYRLTFGSKEYFAPEECFYPDVKVHFEIKDASKKHHIPLLISPYGFTTYRGS